MKLLMVSNLLDHNKIMESPVKNKRGTLYGVPSLFRGMVRGKRFMIVGGLFPVSDLAVQWIFSFDLVFNYHNLSEMSNKIY